MNENQLFEQLKAGDSRAFAAIYLQWFDPICNFLRLFTRSAEDAEDIAHDVFTTLWEKRGSIDPLKNGRALLFHMARNRVMNMHKKKSAARNYLASAEHSSDEGVTSHDIVIAKEIELLTEYALSTMPEQRREAYLLSYKDGLSIPEIAQKMGIPDKNVRNHLYQARKFLKEVITILLLFL